jgi:D-alanine transaminase
MKLQNRTVYLNGRFLPIEEASISVLDRGFLFGDGVYEVIPVFEGRLFRASQHLKRLEKSLAAIEIPSPYNTQQWLELFTQLLEKNKHLGANQAVYLQVTRGIAERTHFFPEEYQPTVFIQTTVFSPTPLSELSKGAPAITVADNRWHLCSIKAITLLPNVLASQQAKTKKSKEAIFIRDHFAIEGTSSNLFIVKNGILITPALSDELLPGITRELVLELAKQHQIPYREEAISEQDLKNADEIWMTGSLKEVLPITELDGQAVGNGKVGPVWHTLIQYYEACKQHTEPAKVKSL